MQISVQFLGKKWLFVPHRWLTFLVVILLPILLSLSYWQWQRGLYKQHMLDAFEVKRCIITFAGHATMPVAPYQPIRIQGQFKPQYQFFLDNQIVAGRAGFYVVVPFELEPNKEWLLVNLGWLPRHAIRAQLPTVPPLSTETMTLTGRTYFPSQDYLLLGTHLEEIQPHQIIIQTLDFQRLNEYIQRPLLPLVMLLDPEADTIFVRNWQPPQTLPPAKHYGYAVQWLLLAVTLAILYIIFCIRNVNPK